MVNGTAIVLTNGGLKERHAKTAHGLLRGSQRFTLMGIIDPEYAGKNTGDIFPELETHIPIFKAVSEAVEKLPQKPAFCIIGVALHGGILPTSFRKEIIQAIKCGISIVSGLHTQINDDPEFHNLSQKYQVKLIDVRKPPPLEQRHFWSGESLKIKTPRIAILGMDCVIGKRTTGNLLRQICEGHGIRTEFIYTGQTGWMQGLKYGFVFDATVNDFISGEIERQIIQCYEESHPDLILIEGQSSLRNPSGPCGSEFILSGNCKGVVLQHAPGRIYYDGMEELKITIPAVEEEVDLIRYYGAKTLAITLNEENISETQMKLCQQELQKKLSIPVVRPLNGELPEILSVIRRFLKEYK